MAGLAVVLDANILIRFAIGRQVPRLLATYAATVDFLAPDTAFVEAKRNLPSILRARGHPGVGVPIWTTARVEVYFTDPDPGAAQH